MIATILDVISWGIMLTGSLFVVVGAIGIYRFPDFYTRLHAAGITDTMGAELIIIGLMFQAGLTVPDPKLAFLIILKLNFIGVFLFFTSPTATHAIANAAITAGLKPFLTKHPDEASNESPNKIPGGSDPKS